MSKEPVHDEKTIPSKLSISKWMIMAFILFVIIGYILAMPCLCQIGAVKGFYKTIFYIIVLTRLIYGLYKKKLSWMNYILWVVGFVAFCIIAEYL